MGCYEYTCGSPSGGTAVTSATICKGLTTNLTVSGHTARAIKWQQTFYDIDFGLKYAVNLNRKPGDWDFIDGEFLEDLEKVNFYLSKVLDNGVTVAFRIENLTDQVVEVVPYYNNNGREVYLTIDYKW